MKYTIVWAQELHTLAEEVNARIKEGWTPLGGLTTMPGSSLPDPKYYQAMTRKLQ